jgi:hypothetical protein
MQNKLDNITVIMNGYKRPWLQEQLNAINNQTIKPKEILLWYNYPGEDSLINRNVASKCKTALCNHNFGVWARFAFALNSKYKYVCIFDDDTIPGERWLENCLNESKVNRGLYGTRGIVFTTRDTYFGPNERYGWAAADVPAVMNDKSVEVDIVGHSWFFEKEFLSSYWRELPDPEYIFCGEDMHFSYTIQKYLNLKTYVPPHPENDRSLWGSLKGEKYGGGMVSLWQGNPHIQLDATTIKSNHQLMNEYYVKQCKKDWKLVKDKS